MTSSTPGTRDSLTIVAETWVPGHPKTKGSLDFKGKHAEENVRGSKVWRALVAERVGSWRAARGLTVPSSAPIGVRALFVLPVPIGLAASTPVELIGTYPPIETRTGDVDKLARNVLDALKDAGAYVDDVQVCRLICNKIYADQSMAQGALVQVWELTPWQIRQSRRVADLGEYLRRMGVDQ